MSMSTTTTTETVAENENQSGEEWGLALAVGKPGEDGKAPRPRARAKWTAIGLEISEAATLEDISSWVRLLKEARDSGEVALADIITYARRKDLANDLETVLESVSFDLATVKRAVAIADVPRGLRSNRLTAEHYYVVSRVALYEDQVLWLQRAIDHKLSGFELKRSIELGRVMTRQELLELTGSGSGGIVNYQGVLTSFKRWEGSIGGTNRVLSWPDSLKEQFLAEWRPVKEMLDEVEADLAKRRLSLNAAAGEDNSGQ